MCGILGRIGNFEVNQEKFEYALNLQKHRGPDDFGLDFGENFALGHRRLSIIDLSSLAHQPMSTADGKIKIVFNGEIYNFQEIRADLERKGHSFVSKSDTEVLLKGYQEHGIQILDKLIGMFAFCIIDLNKMTAFLVRDRLGIKPLYIHYRNQKELIFSSEVKSILALAPEANVLNESSIYSYLSFRYPIYTGSFFRGIESVKPGHYVQLSLKDTSEFTTRKYWDFVDCYREQNEDFGEAFYLQQLRELMHSSVAYRMIADVPVGSFLSGGVDSSVITALMAQESGSRINSFTIGYGEEEYDEYRYSNIVAKQYGTQHREIYLPEEDYFEYLTYLIDKKDAPLVAPHEVSLYKMSHELRKHVTVVLSGEGADEIFGGYGRIFRSADDFTRYQNIETLGKGDQVKFLTNFKIKYGKTSFNQEVDHFLYLYGYTKPDELNELVSPDSIADGPRKSREFFTNLFAQVPSDIYLNKMMYSFIKVHLPGLLLRADSSTMAASVETRVPFVDHRLVELSARIPIKYKLKWKNMEDKNRAMTLMGNDISEVYDVPKYILKKAFEGDLSDEVLYRKKLGFPVPLDRWLGGKSKQQMKAVLLDDSTKKRGIINTNAVENWLNERKRPLTHPRALKLWMLLNLEIFIRKNYEMESL